MEFPETINTQTAAKILPTQEKKDDFSIIKESAKRIEKNQVVIANKDLTKEDLSSITFLDLTGVSLTGEVPEIVREMKALQTLILNYNEIKELPEFIVELPNLTRLYQFNFIMSY